MSKEKLCHVGYGLMLAVVLLRAGVCAAPLARDRTCVQCFRPGGRRYKYPFQLPLKI